jgi:drug/metabolite transporter (DMT)-like permease
MSRATIQPENSKDWMGFIYGLLGVLIFSLTLPATRIAVSGFDPVFVGLGRAIVAALLSAMLLVLTRQPIPSSKYLTSFCIVVVGVVIGFPLLSAIAMRDAPASYGAVITGLLPLSTALCGVWRAGERPSLPFWIFAGLGSILVICFALLSGRGSLRVADLALLGAVAAAGLGYAEGAVLSRTLGAWQVICWALVLSSPVLLPIVWQHIPANFALVPFNAVLSFLYVSIFSMFLGFFAWYQGLSLGGVARVGQLQLLQPFLTILASKLFLGESLTFTTLIFAAGVLLCVVLGKQTQIRTIR